MLHYVAAALCIPSVKFTLQFAYTEMEPKKNMKDKHLSAIQHIFFQWYKALNTVFVTRGNWTNEQKYLRFCCIYLSISEQLDKVEKKLKNTQQNVTRCTYMFSHQQFTQRKIWKMCCVVPSYPARLIYLKHKCIFNSVFFFSAFEGIFYIFQMHFHISRRMFYIF